MTFEGQLSWGRLTTAEALETIEILVAEGMCQTRDDAVHFLADAGEINQNQHAKFLSEEERKRVYG